MSELNNGAIRVSADRLDEVIEVMNKLHISYYTGNIKRDNFYVYDRCKIAEYEISDISGDIHDELVNLVDGLSIIGITPDISIHYDDGYGGSGEYTVENGKLTVLSSDEVAIRTATTEDLLAELDRRGVNHPCKADDERYHLDIYFDEDDFCLTAFESDDLELIKKWGQTLWKMILDPDIGYMAMHAGWLAVTDSKEGVMYKFNGGNWKKEEIV